jgi:hypothetical protein
MLKYYQIRHSQSAMPAKAFGMGVGIYGGIVRKSIMIHNLHFSYNIANVLAINAPRAHTKHILSTYHTQSY